MIITLKEIVDMLKLEYDLLECYPSTSELAKRESWEPRCDFVFKTRTIRDIRIYLLIDDLYYGTTLTRDEIIKEICYLLNMTVDSKESIYT
jgi:hypothetical protein